MGSGSMGIGAGFHVQTIAFQTDRHLKECSLHHSLAASNALFESGASHINISTGLERDDVGLALKKNNIQVLNGNA
jgi:hypothetical protein